VCSFGELLNGGFSAATPAHRPFLEGHNVPLCNSILEEAWLSHRLIMNASERIPS